MKKYLAIANKFLGNDKRAEFILSDGEEWVMKNRIKKFDFIFADTWHGKYLLLDEVLAMLSDGGLYIIDDMLPQPNWPDGHAEKVVKLISVLEQKNDLSITKFDWSRCITFA